MSNLTANDLLKKVRKIEIKTRKLSHQIFAGEYHSAFKGRGMVFSEVREYQYGDDVRNMDWNVTARLRAPYVKVFEEERELTVVLLVDVSRSRLFGTTGASRKDVLAEIAAVLSFSALINNDKVGALFFSDKVEKFIPPKKGRSHLLHIIREIIEFEPTTDGTDISEALRYLTNAIKKRCTAFLLSDMLDVDASGNPNYEEALKVAVNRHDLSVIVEGGDGFAMFRGAKVVENSLATDYLVLADYAKAFAKGEDGLPRISTAGSPLAALPNYPVAYEKPNGSGRISFKGLAGQ